MEDQPDMSRPRIISAAVGVMRKHPSWGPSQALAAAVKQSNRWQVYFAALSGEDRIVLATQVYEGSKRG